MTTHVFIVDDNTFKYHLEYMFAGTGAKEKSVDFNNLSTTKLYSGRRQAGENSLVGMMADGCRVRKNDLKNEFKRFNQESNVLPLKYIEYEILENNLFFKIVDYQK